MKALAAAPTSVTVVPTARTVVSIVPWCQLNVQNGSRRARRFLRPPVLSPEPRTSADATPQCQQVDFTLHSKVVQSHTCLRRGPRDDIRYGPRPVGLRQRHYGNGGPANWGIVHVKTEGGSRKLSQKHVFTTLKKHTFSIASGDGQCQNTQIELTEKM